MIMKKTIILWLCLFTLFGCERVNKDANAFKYNIPIENIKETVGYEDLIDTLTYIALEKNENAIIGDIKDLIVANNKIYVSDNNGVYVFDINGKHLYSINRKGHSKSEFTFINSINISDNILFLYDNSQNKLLCFDAQDGKFINSIVLPWRAGKVYGDRNYLYVDFAGWPTDIAPNGERIAVVNKENIEKADFAVFDDEEFKIPIDGTCKLMSDGIAMTSYYNCKIWIVNSDGVHSYINIERASDKIMSKEMLNEMISNHHLSKNDDSPYIYGLSNVCETNKNITGRIFCGNNAFNFVFNKQSNKVVCYKQVLYNNSQFYLPPAITSDDEYCYSVLSSVEIDYIKDTEQSQSLSFPKTIDSDGNPLIIQYRFKMR